MKKITTLFLGILLVPVFTFAQTATTTDSYKAQLIAVLTQLVQQLEAEIALIIAQQAQLAAQQQILSQQTQSQIPQNTTQVFGSTQTVDSVVNAGPVSNAPTCTLTAATTTASVARLSWTSSNVTGGVLYYEIPNNPPMWPVAIPDMAADPYSFGNTLQKGSEGGFSTNNNGQETDFKAVFSGPNGNVTCLASITTNW